MQKCKILLTLPDETRLKLIEETFGITRGNCLDLREKYTDNEVEDILDGLAYLNNLYRKHGASKIIETMMELSIPEQLWKMYAQPELSLTKTLHLTYTWRVDLSVPKANVILLNIHKSNGECVCLRFDVSSFHLLRFNIATLLKELKIVIPNCNRIKMIN